jgi:rsbT antagonist protein RsbS
MQTIPIIKIEEFLIVSIQIELHDKLALQLQDDILREVKRTGAKGVLIDLTAVDIVDSFMGRLLTETALMVKILGAETVVVGIQPEVAITLVELGLDLRGVYLALNAELGIALLRRIRRRG